jgi:L-lactate utilization protein LutB
MISVLGILVKVLLKKFATRILKEILKNVKNLTKKKVIVKKEIELLNLHYQYLLSKF